MMALMAWWRMRRKRVTTRNNTLCGQALVSSREVSERGLDVLV
jgi:hypothetical protein